MKIHKLRYVILLAAVYLIISSSCKKFVQIEAPLTQISTLNVFKTALTATSAQTAIYQLMVNNSESWQISQNMGLLSDELTNYSTNIGQIQFYTNSLNATTAPGPWANAYNYIYQANAIIEGLGKSVDLQETVKRQLLGEAKFIRAFWYFYLVNIYGGVPLITSTDYTNNSTVSRSSPDAVYNHIVGDLTEAKQNLNENFVDATDSVITSDRIRPTKWAASAFLARVYLYTHEYAKADQEATSVIENSSLFKLSTNLQEVFLKNSSEAIWQLGIPTPTNYNTPDGQYYILLSAPLNTNNNSTTISKGLLSEFDSSDKRRISWIGYYTDPSSLTDTFFFPYKYKVYQSSDISEYVMVLRLAEQYLIRAEAETEEGKFAEAIKDINSIRHRAGLLDYNGAVNRDSLLPAILRERRLELFTEWGHRWLDLIRTGNIDSVMEVVAPLKGSDWISNYTVYPIPQSERALDPNLTQNIGY